MAKRGLFSRSGTRLKTKKGNFWGRLPKGRRPIKKSQKPKKLQYKHRYIVEMTTDQGRKRPIKTLRDPEAAKNFVAKRKYRFPGAEYNIRPEKIKRGW